MKTNSFQLLFIILFASTLLSGCSKSDSTSTRIAKTVSLLFPNDSVAYTYSSDGKMTGYRNYSSGAWRTYEYSKSRVTEAWGANISEQQAFNTYYLNSKGLADSMIRIMNKIPLCLQFKYDSSDIRVEETVGCSDSSLSMRRIIKGGNVVKQMIYSGGKPFQTFSYEYYSDQPNRANVLAQEKMGQAFRGRDSKNLLKKEVLVNADSEILQQREYFYYFDDLGRISTVTTYSNSSTPSDSVKYYY